MKIIGIDVGANGPTLSAELPVGGTTGLDHETSASIDEAASWLASQPFWPSPIIPALKATHGLNPLEACAAIREARLKLARAM